MTDEELNARFGQLVDAQLHVQEQIGDLAGIMRQVIARQDRHEAELQDLRQRQAESDQRFDILLQEIRYLIHQQQPPTQEEEQS